ncbi:MAG TPA: tryptophan--tRNA ligase [Planctomycetota bacterium]
MIEKVDVLSGVQPTGQAHVGNWLGAFQNWVTMQEAGNCFYCIVDLHALTSTPNPPALRAASLEMARVFLAIGLDPGRSALFLQSDVPSHAELAWVFQCLTPMGDLQRMTQFKDKSAKQPKNINVGLFTYPVLQTADILIYKAASVPVGEDQVQHLELAREIARRFNNRYTPIFPEPEPRLAKASRIMGLDAVNKMSKSLGNHVPLLAPPEEIHKRVRKAVTDPQRVRREDPGRPEVCNVFALHGHFTPATDVAGIAADCRSAALGCVDCKTRLADNMAARLAPVRERAAELERDPDQVRDVLRAGAARARVVADATMAEVRDAVGLGV